MVGLKHFQDIIGLTFPMQSFSDRKKNLKLCYIPKINSLVCSERKTKTKTKNYQKFRRKIDWVVLNIVSKYSTIQQNTMKIAFVALLLFIL